MKTTETGTILTTPDDFNAAIGETLRRNDRTINMLDLFYGVMAFLVGMYVAFLMY